MGRSRIKRQYRGPFGHSHNGGIEFAPCNDGRSPTSLVHCGLKQESGLKQENERLAGEVARLTKELAAAATAAAVPATREPCGSEGRLRTLLTSCQATAAELRSAIAGVDALVSEARRELANMEVRERRAAYERLHKAVGNDDMEVLAAEIEAALAAGVDAEELEKANHKLKELQYLTPEQRLARANERTAASRKQAAFVFVKRDDAEGLKELLEVAERSGTAWNSWKDWAGRSLVRSAQDLRSVRVQAYLASKLGLHSQGARGARRSVEENDGGESHEGPHSPGVRAALHSIEELTPTKEGALLSPTARCVSSTTLTAKEAAVGEDADTRGGSDTSSKPLSGFSLQVARLGIGGASETPEKVTRLATALVTPRAKARSCLDLGQHPYAAMASAISKSGAASALITPRISAQSQDTTRSSTPVLSPANSGSASPTRAGSNEPLASEKAAALRAVVKDDAVTLRTILDRLDVAVWSKWENKAGKDLITLSQERGSSLAYSLIARQLGLLKDLHREVFEEREAVWIFEAGEVAPRRATILEDTPADADDIKVEFWDGDEPPTYVERCFVRKMA